MKRVYRMWAVVPMVVLCFAIVLSPVDTARSQDGAANPNILELSPQLRLSFADPGIRDILTIGTVRVTEGGERFPRLLLEVTSNAPDRIALEYRVQWLDRDGFPVAPYSSWFSLFLQTNTPAQIVSTGRKKSAYRAQVALRYARQ